MDQHPQLKEKREEFWRGHILEAEKYGGTFKQYCEKQELNVQTFSTYRKRLGFTLSKKRKSFAKVIPSVESVVRPVRLPDPRWLAEFLIALQNRR